MSEQRKSGGSATNWLGFLFLFGFGAAFALGGLTSLYFVIARPEPGTEDTQIIGVVVGGIFALVGLGISLAAFKMRAIAAGRQALRLEHPEEPWLWRPDWRERRIEGNEGRKALILWIFTLLWNLASWIIAPLALADADADDKPAVYLVLLFPLVGLGLLAGALVLSQRLRRYGKSVFVPASLPAVIGGELQGRIVISRMLEPERDIRLRVACLRIITRGSGKNSSTQEETLFETSETLGASDLVQDGHGTEIPVRFTIPWGWPPSDDENQRNRVVWRLEAEAEMIGVDYKASFEIPTFVTADSDRQLAEKPRTPIDLEEADRRGSPFEHSKIGLRRLEGGAIELDFPSGRNPSLVIVLGIIAVVWGGVVVLLARSDAPLLFPLVFGLFEALIVLALVHSLLSASIVHLRPDGVGYEKRVLGFIKRGWHAREEIAGLSIDVAAQSGSRTWHRLQLDLRSGKTVTLADGIPDRDEALALEAAAEEVLGPRRSQTADDPVRE